MPIGIAGAIHVLLFVVLLPIAAIRSVGQLRDHGWPPRTALFRSILIQQVFFLIVSVLIARFEHIALPVTPDSVPDVLAGVLGGVILIACLWPVWKSSIRQRDTRLVMTMPRTGREMALWCAVSVAAGVTEEIAYRGVLFALLHRVTGSPVAAAVLASVAFGVGHSVQGWRGTAVVGLVALALHAVTWFTGSLVPAILIHVLYDIAAGYGMSVLGRREGLFAEPDPIPPSGLPTSDT